MNAEVKLETQPTFRTENLPPLLARFATELAGRYSIDPLVPVALMLSAIGAAAGRRFSLDTGLGAEPVSANSFLALAAHPGSQVEPLLSHVLRPLRERQHASRLHDQTGPPGRAGAAAKIARERERFFRAERHPDRSHARYFDGLLEAQTASSHSCFLLESPGLGRLSGATEQSRSGNLYAIYDGLAVSTLFEKLGTRAGRFDLEMMARGWDGKPFEGLFLEGASDAVLLHPCASLLLHANALELHRLLTHPVLAKTGLAEKFLVVDPGAPLPLTQRVFTGLTGGEDWAELINELLDGPDECAPLVLQASVHARAVGCRFSNQVLAWRPAIPEDDQPFVFCWPQIAWRWMLALHLCSEDPLAPVPRSAAEAAVALVQSLGERQLAFLREGRAANEKKAQASAADLMLAKIATRGRISPRDLFRLYNDQRREVHDPVIARLRQEGRIREDEEGCLVPAGRHSYSGA